MGPSDGADDQEQNSMKSLNKGDYSTSVILRICGVGQWGSFKVEMGVDSNWRRRYRYGHWRGFVTEAIICL